MEAKVLVELAALQPHPQNYNRHGPRQIKDIATSLERFGQRKPLTTWRGFILTGHGVAEAARSLGWREVWAEPCPDEWDEATALAWLAADNELPRAADPDEAQLAALVALIQESDARLAELAAGSAARLRELLAQTKAPVEDAGAQIDKAEELREKWKVEVGQLWQLGEHRVICGDCTDRAVVERVMQGKKAAVVSDPPYGIDVDTS